MAMKISRLSPPARQSLRGTKRSDTALLTSWTGLGRRQRRPWPREGQSMALRLLLLQW